MRIQQTKVPLLSLLFIVLIILLAEKWGDWT